MESSVSSTISLHEKLTNSTTFLVIISAILFTEHFLYFSFGVDLFSVSFEWYQSNVQFKHIVCYSLLCSVCYGLIAPALLASLDFIIKFNSKNATPESNNYVPLHRLKYDAIIDNNAVAFEFYEKKMTEISQTAHVRKLMIGIVVLSALGIFRWLLSIDPSHGLISTTIEFIGQDDFIAKALQIFVLFLSVWFLAKLSSPPDEYFDYVYIENYSAIKINGWIREIESSLINKEELFLNLENIYNAHWLPSYEIDFDPSNSAHSYCKKHGLLKLVNHKIKLTEKGQFFTKYIPTGLS